MKKKILLAAGVTLLAVSAYAAMRCTFCNGTGFGNGGKSTFTCTFCKGRGSN